MLYSIFIFLLAGLCEIGGGYLIWLWLREGQSSWLGFIGGVILMMYVSLQHSSRFQLSVVFMLLMVACLL